MGTNNTSGGEPARPPPYKHTLTWEDGKPGTVGERAERTNNSFYTLALVSLIVD